MLISLRGTQCSRKLISSAHCTPAFEQMRLHNKQKPSGENGGDGQTFRRCSPRGRRASTWPVAILKPASTRACSCNTSHAPDPAWRTHLPYNPLFRAADRPVMVTTTQGVHNGLQQGDTSSGWLIDSDSSIHLELSPTQLVLSLKPPCASLCEGAGALYLLSG